MTEKATIHGFEVTRAVGLSDKQRENNRKWVAALRSGEYTQATQHLKTECGYCCLGVGELVLGSSFQFEDASDRWFVQDGRQPMFDKLTLASTKAYGLPSDSGSIAATKPGSHHRCSLMELNDLYAMTFGQIADIIAYWAGLEDAPVETAEKASEAGA